ncbi:MAG: PASTA domain-containing protein [Tannerella sp.]|jgi:hypothetical protein|nr:PASTA domain-containing protein [Tannerella sp.]
MRSFLDKILGMPIYVHLLAVCALLCLIVFVTLKRIDSYTNHNQAVVVPDVRGLQIEKAAPFFEKNFLRYVIIDSIYSKEVAPGAIIELSPDANAKVKKNRIVYVTVNAKTEEATTIPEIADISYRQAYALLKSRGFAKVDVKYVSSEFRDLAIGVEYGGRMLESGDRVPLTAKIILVVGDGNILSDSADSTDVQGKDIIGGEESWF